MTEVGTFFGVSATTVRSSWKAAGMPGKSGAYDLKLIGEWKRSRPGDPESNAARSNGEAESVVSATGRLRDTEARIAAEKLIRLQMENAARRGELISVTEARQDLATILVIVKARLESISGDCVVEIPQRQRQTVGRVVTRKIELALKELATTQVTGCSCDDAILAAADAIRATRSAADTEEQVA